MALLFLREHGMVRGGFRSAWYALTRARERGTSVGEGKIVVVRPHPRPLPVGEGEMRQALSRVWERE